MIDLCISLHCYICICLRISLTTVEIPVSGWTVTCLDIVNETIKNGYHFVGDTCVGMDLRLLSQISLTKLLRMAIGDTTCIGMDLIICTRLGRIGIFASRVSRTGS